MGDATTTSCNRHILVKIAQTLTVYLGNSKKEQVKQTKTKHHEKLQELEKQ
ncbi:hypothetical protein DOY81_000940 [Sarcophaga bullata]|nr:hypothetical protein DOY81_000940 [Sarcophaga bullata]